MMETALPLGFRVMTDVYRGRKGGPSSVWEIDKPREGAISLTTKKKLTYRPILFLNTYITYFPLSNIPNILITHTLTYYI